MAKFRKLLIGGVVGAGLAFALSRREVRKMLMGAGRKALPAAPETSGPSGYAPYKPATAPPPSATPEAPAAAPVDLDTMIAQTQAKVEEHVESFGAPAAADEALAQEAAWLEAPPAAEPVVEEPAAPVVPPQLLQESPFLEEPMVAPIAEPEAEAPVAEPAAEISPVEAPPAEAPVDLLGPAPARGAGLSDWESLQFPAAGEPTIESHSSIAEPPVAAPEPPAATPEPPAAEAETPGPAGIDREEMRRRIDETRSRLKAKAFDAMVSGETFIDETEAEKAESHTEASSGLDADVEKSIDDSLREAD